MHHKIHKITTYTSNWRLLCVCVCVCVCVWAGVCVSVACVEPGHSRMKITSLDRPKRRRTPRTPGPRSKGRSQAAYYA